MRLRDAWDRIRGLRGRAAMQEEIAEEVAFHLEREAERLLREGLPPAEARRRARLAFGGADRYMEAARDEQRSRWVEDAAVDVKLAVRSLRASPAFALVAVLSLAVGIGGSAAMFSVVNAVLLQPLRYGSPNALVRVSVLNANQAFASALSAADAIALDSAGTFAAFGVWGEQQGGFAVLVGGESESVRGGFATAGLFEALGVPARLGRTFVKADHAPGAPPVVLLSHGYWQERFGSDPAVVGRTLRLDGEPHTVVGVMPPGFALPRAQNHALWVAPPVVLPEVRAVFWLIGVGRIASGASLLSAAAELEHVRQLVMERYPGASRGWRYDVEPLKQSLVRSARPTLLVLFGAVGLVLAIATANVANLLLARATMRAPELALRSALGAGRGRLVRQLLAESLSLGVLGGFLGIVLAWASVRVLPTFAPDGLPRRGEVALDATVLAFALGVSLLVGIVIGVLPAVRASRADLAARIGGAGRGGVTDARMGRARAALVVLEFALAVAVMVGAGLVVNSLARLHRVDAGINVDRLLTVQVAIPRERYAEPGQVAGFFDPLVERVRALPGVTYAAVGSALPPHRLVMRPPFTPEGKVYAAGERAPVAAEVIAGEGFFETLGVPLVRGRFFDATDRLDSRPVTIIDETLARTHFPGVDPVGRWLTTGDNPEAMRLTIVGVVGDVKYAGLDAPPEPTLYVPFEQNRWWRSMYLVARTRGEPLALVPAVRAAIAELDPLVPIRELSTIERLASESVAEPRFRAFLLASFGAVALLLACAGIYGVLAYDVARRRRETGIRMALGAGRGRIVRDVVGRGMRHAALGIALGAIAAAALTRVLESMLFEVDPLDPVTFAAALAILAAVGLAGCALPAVRAARADPMHALRTD